MLIVHMSVQVLSERVDAFREATLANARCSVKEPGIARFDVVQQNDGPTRFVLTKLYGDKKAPAKHKQTAHNALWQETVSPMMTKPSPPISR